MKALPQLPLWTLVAPVLGWLLLAGTRLDLLEAMEAIEATATTINKDQRFAEQSLRHEVGISDVLIALERQVRDLDRPGAAHHQRARVGPRRQRGLDHRAGRLQRTEVVDAVPRGGGSNSSAVVSTVSARPSHCWRTRSSSVARMR